MQAPQQRKLNDRSRSEVALDPNTTLIGVIEMNLAIRLVTGSVSGIERQSPKKLKSDENAHLALLNRWCDEASRS